MSKYEKSFLLFSVFAFISGVIILGATLYTLGMIISGM